MMKVKRGSDGTPSFQKNIKACKPRPFSLSVALGLTSQAATQSLFSVSAGPGLTGQAATQSAWLPNAEKRTWVSGHLHVDTDEDVWAGLSDARKTLLSKTVAAITLCNGETSLFSCSGVAIDSQENHVTMFLTSASLARALIRTATKDYMNLKIKVRHEGNKVHEGFLAEADFNHNFAVVNVRTLLDVHVGLQHVQEIPPHDDDVLLVALGRDICGKLITKTMKLRDNSSVFDDDEELDGTIFEGGPLFSLDGHFVGMILRLNLWVASFQPWNTILENLKQQLSPALVERVQVYRFGASHIAHTGHKMEHLDYRGYPALSSTIFGGVMILVNTFEETFGDICGDGALSKLDKKASYLKDCVVALASYNGGKRFFACTGFFIEWNGSLVIVTSASLVRNSGDENKIVENLTIMVAFPDGNRKEGQLKNYSLHFNIALVSVDLCHQHAFRPAEVLVSCPNVHQVAAVGRCFESGALMATTGKVVPCSGTLDCRLLVYATCKITKAGIGGPVVTLDGHVLGMNFYDKIGTPFLTWHWISGILKSFEGNSKAGEVDSTGVQFRSILAVNNDRLESIGGELCDGGSWGHVYKIGVTDKNRLNRWPVPMPCWRRPCDHADQDIVEDDRFTYFGGIRVMLF